MERIKKLIKLLLLSLNLLSCSLEARIESPSIEESQSLYEETGDLFIDTLDSDGYVLTTFETNNTDYISSDGYTLWSIKNECDPSVFNEIDCSVSKISGNANCGYGIIFCGQTYESSEYMFALLINTNQMYTVGKVKDGIFTSILDWTSSSSLKSGFSVDNRIQIQYSSDLDLFTLLFNEKTETVFQDIGEPYLRGGSIGYAVVISPYEKFPETSVKLYFKTIN